MSEVTSQAWALDLVAGWCERRAQQEEERRLLKRCRTAYRAGPLVDPVKRYADLLEAQIKTNAAQWRELGQLMRAQAAEAATASIPPAAI